MTKAMNRNPFDFDNLFRAMERNLESAWRGTTGSVASPAMDIYEKPDALYVRAALPGINDEDVDVSVEKDVVTIRGAFRCDYEGEQTRVYLLETPYGSFTRSVRLPATVDADKAEAIFDRGVLTIRIPKIDEMEQVRRIPVRMKEPTQSISEGESAEAPPQEALEAKAV